MKNSAATSVSTSGSARPPVTSPERGHAAPIALPPKIAARKRAVVRAGRRGAQHAHSTPQHDRWSASMPASRRA
ncbi:hypothetical protein [Microbacterium indicum]|uniref:hypothetical protein n=1 Tax=Microbacterium indicum TaxID=358100 RepID=UPI000422B776|nr:hypothetical protein [Microbacterium indicum]